MKIILFPFRVLMRLIAAIMGGVFILIGGILTFTVVGAFVGVPMIVIGIPLFLRALF